MIAEIHDTLAAAGHKLKSIRRTKGGALEVVMQEGATEKQRAAAQAAAEAWAPTRATKIRAEARARGLSPLQLAALRIESARDAGTAAPPWAKQVLRAEALGDLDAKLA